MLTPKQLSVCTEEITALYGKLNDSIVQKIVKALVKGTFTKGKADLVLRLQQSGKLYEDIVKEASAFSGKSDEYVKELFEEASVKSVKFDNKIYKEAGLNVVQNMSAPALKILEANIKKTSGYLNNLTKTTAEVSQQSFISACTLAEMQIESGAFSYTEAVRQAIHSVIDNGTEVLYPTGHRDKLDVAVRRAALTGVGQTTGEISLKNAESLGCDLMEITAHYGARPSHAEWQGKIVSLSGREGYLTLADIGYGTGAGFKGYNCRHDWFPYFEGMSKKAYSDEELENKKDETVTYEGKEMSRYCAEQKQRAMERQIRKERSKLAGIDTAIKASSDEELKASLKNDFDSLSVKLKSHEAKYKDFSYKTGLPPQKQRLQMYGFNKSVSRKAVHNAQKHYDVWRKSIGADDTPKTLAKYYDMKYNNKKQYELLQDYSKAVDKGIIPALTTLSNYNNIIDEISEKLIGTQLENNVKITGYKKHFLERIIGTFKDDKKGGKPQSGVSVDNILEALLNGESTNIVYKKSSNGVIKPSKVYFTDKCHVSINPETGKLIQCTPCY